MKYCSLRYKIKQASKSKRTTGHTIMQSNNIYEAHKTNINSTMKFSEIERK